MSPADLGLSDHVYVYSSMGGARRNQHGFRVHELEKEALAETIFSGEMDALLLCVYRPHGGRSHYDDPDQVANTPWSTQLREALAVRVKPMVNQCFLK